MTIVSLVMRDQLDLFIFLMVSCCMAISCLTSSNCDVRLVSISRPLSKISIITSSKWLSLWFMTDSSFRLSGFSIILITVV